MHVSVIIPLFNKARFIRRSLDSVLMQTIKDYEVIVVDDGSTDDGPEIVAGYGDRRIRLIRQENRGVSAARNAGIKAASGHYIAFLDADDTWKTNYLEIVASLIERYPGAGAYATAYEIVRRNGMVVRPEYKGVPRQPWQGLLPSYFRSSLGTPPVCSSATTVPKYVIHEVGFFPVGIPLGEDLDMWGRIALRYPIAFCNKIGASYIQDDQHPGSRHHYYITNPEAVFVRSAREAIGRGEIRTADLSDLTEYMVKLQLAVGYDCLVEGGNPAAARKILLNTRPATAHLKWKKYRTLLQTYLPGKF
ncbi:MAG: glycosyltransferase family A protein [Nitrospirota bacterium]